MIKWYLGGFLILIAFAGGIYVTHSFYVGKNDRISTESAIVIAEKLSEVLQLVTMKGEFSEIYSYEDYRSWNWFPLRKKALMRVDAKVAVGFDLEDFCAYVDEGRRVVVVNQPAPPKILSIDHRLSYYDIQQGAFNVFTPADYNRIQSRAKDNILSAASSNPLLFQGANTQWDDLIKSFEQMLNAMGWELEVHAWEPQEEKIIGPGELMANWLGH
ncbi:MAG: DUF4230 domain-containing protein [Saprospirales bacterium]|nr:MAG: DUF4230 domain-containing protein [Saprospirales bacterium]